MADFSLANFGILSSYAAKAGLKYDPSFGPKIAASFKDIKPEESFLTTPNIPTYGGSVSTNPAQGESPSAFTFITAPSGVSYSQGAEVNQVAIFGTNNPPITVGSLNAAELELSDALMEGFTLGKEVQTPIDNLLKMMQVSLSGTNGFVNVPVYKVVAGPTTGEGRVYGNFVIEDVSVSEEMRDLRGRTTRAKVGVRFKQVPEYQIGTGRDQATATSGGDKIDPIKATGQATSQNGRVAAANAGGSTPASKPSKGGSTPIQGRDPTQRTRLR